ncbi:hypothetical protein DXG01_008885 [Tephrocybe rancida]|nr:hypothetical protein DXG01_008885 [Tephrocybe rancida]
MAASPPTTLPSTVEETLAFCPRFRILIVGNSGVGKSSLIRNIFNVPQGIDQDIDVADGHAGHADINTGYMSEDNPRFVLHDSKGFEPGTTNNWDIVKVFIRRRCKEGSVKDQLHAIWLCVETPREGSRLTQTADEDLLKLAKSLKLPVIVVFTKYDILVKECYLNLVKNGGKQTNTSKILGDAEKAAKVSLDKSIETFKQEAGKIQNISRVSKLLNPRQRHTTFVPVSTEEKYHGHSKMLAHERDVGSVGCGPANRPKPEGGVFPRSTPVELIVNAEYMRNMGKSTVFKGHILGDCLLRIHLDIVKVWNFRDPERLLSGDDFRKEMVLLIQQFMPQTQSSSTLQQRLPIVSALAGIFGTVYPPLALALGLAGLAVVAIEFLYNTYQAAPQTALCLRAYIVDLTLVLYELFVTGLKEQRQQPLTGELLSETLKRYKESRSEGVHRRICNSIPKSAPEAFSAQANKENVGDLIRLELSLGRK